MGSASSKDAASSSSSGGASRRSSSRSRGIRPLNSSCFRLPSVLEDDQSEEDNAIAKVHAHTDEAVNKSARRDNEGCSRLKFPRHSKMPLLTSSDVEDNEEGQNSTAPINLDASSSSSTATASNGRSVNPSGRSRSRFAFIPDRIGFRLSRTVSLGSSGAQTRFSDHLSIPNSDGDGRVLVSLENSAGNPNEAQHNVSVETNSSRDMLRSDVAVEHTIRSYSHRSRIDSESAEMRRLNRRLGPQEPLEGSVRFSRTLSVGRLRDRVLRRTTSSEGVFGTAMLEDRYTELANARRGIGGRQRVASSSHRSNDVLPDSSSNHSYLMDNLRDGSYGHELETPQPREAASNHDLLEHRSAFLERRRRIRSQVRALQRLGSRFENLSGHDRSCILSGQHRTGRCTCRASNRPANPDDDTSTRASISRIVMLAEALFEVLDEIHQQSVVMSSRPSFSSIGSVPAPKEVVECMPVKAFTKPQKHQNEEAAQCYICLVEYEDGDYMRILPCNHEFHRTCIDKWLKEIHRVCPLCRGDVCRSDVSSVEKVG